MVYTDLSFVVCSGRNYGKYLVGTQKLLRLCPPAGMVSAARIVVCDGGEYSIQVLLRTIETGNVSSFEEFLPICEKINKSGNYKFCPGIDVNVFNEAYSSIHTQAPSLVKKKYSHQKK